MSMAQSDSKFGDGVGGEGSSVKHETEVPEQRRHCDVGREVSILHAGDVFNVLISLDRKRYANLLS